MVRVTQVDVVRLGVPGDAEPPLAERFHVQLQRALQPGEVS